MERKISNPDPESVKAASSRKIDEITVSAHERVDDLSSAAGPVVDRMASSAHAAIDKFAGAAVTAADTLGIKGQQLNNAQAKLLDATRDYVREKPFAALGMALAAGWILSRLRG